jgi:hypothetical protein
VEETLRALSTAVRSFRLYGGESPMLGRFVDDAPRRSWRCSSGDRGALAAPDRGGADPVERVRRSIRPAVRVADLAFVFYKDGIRGLTLLRGFEDEPWRQFLALLGASATV